MCPTKTSIKVDEGGGTSLVVQLRLPAPNVGDTGLTPGWGTGIPCTTWHSQKNFFN